MALHACVSVTRVTEAHTSSVKQAVCTDTDFLEFLLSAIDFRWGLQMFT